MSAISRSQFRGTNALLAMLLSFVVAMPAAADNEKPRLEIGITAEKEVTVTRDGKTATKRIPAVGTHTGDLLVYTLTYTNRGKAPAVNAVIVDPVPNGTVYVLKSAGGDDAEITFSVDGGHFFQPAPAKVKVTLTDGSVVEKTAAPEQYSHIRWHIARAVPPGESGTLWFKVSVQ